MFGLSPKPRDGRGDLKDGGAIEAAPRETLQRVLNSAGEDEIEGIAKVGIVDFRFGAPLCIKIQCFINI